MTIAELENTVNKFQDMGILPHGPVVYELSIEDLNYFLLCAKVSNHAYQIIESPCITILNIVIMGIMFELNFLPIVEHG